MMCSSPPMISDSSGPLHIRSLLVFHPFVLYNTHRRGNSDDRESTRSGEEPDHSSTLLFTVNSILINGSGSTFLTHVDNG